MDFHEILSIYIDKFGDETVIDNMNLSEETEEELYYMYNKAVVTNKPISKKELIDFLGFDPNDPDILI
jgi:hypothetical protein